ncbi:MAG: hypothetical protein RLY11_363 [Bacteroidota bacterium]|jgi:hypothetical protein
MYKFNKMLRKRWVLAICIMSGLGISCSSKMMSYSGDKVFKSSDGIPDYSKVEYWAAHPDKWDPSDTVPLPLRKGSLDKEVDVFFIHPTTYTGAFPEDQPNASIDDSTINYKTDYTSILFQASAFNERARVFAPRYRQAHIQMYQEKDTVKLYSAFNTAYNDVKKAFQYYLDHENKGRPIIIASHSQGTTHSIRLMKEFFDGKQLMNQLVCAYMIGMRVKKDQYEQIPVCTDSSQTGCFVSWRTYRNDYEGEWVNRTDTTTAVVNPISWATNNELVDKSFQKGAVLYNLNKAYYHTQNAQVEGNALWVSHPKFPGSFLYRTKNFHAGDINLFYIDVRENVSKRIDHYKTLHK